MASKSEWSNAGRTVIILVNVLLYNLSIILGFMVKFDREISPFNFVVYERSAIYISIFFIFLNLLLGAHIFYNRKVSDTIFVTVISQISMTLTIMIVIFAGRWFTFPRSVLGYSLIIGITVLSFWQVLVYYLYLEASNERKIVLLGKENQVMRSIQNFIFDKNNKHKVTSVAVSNYYENLRKITGEIDIVYILSNIDESGRIKLYQLIVKHKKEIFLDISLENLIVLEPNMMNFENESIIEVPNFEIQPEENLIKRLFDILVPVCLFAATSPLVLTTTVLAETASSGPVIYERTRTILDQREFSILEFRTVSATAEAKSNPVLSTSNNSRVTTVGKYLHALCIDELPQLINVIRGDMSIVGPRPERPSFVDQFNQENPNYCLHRNTHVRITGYAQVYGKYAFNCNNKLNFDLLYIKNYSLLLDMKILL